jgi:hypothetical protein
LSELANQIRIMLAEIGHQRYATQQYAMVSVLQEQLRLVNEVFLQVRHLADDSHGADGRFAPDVWVGGRQEVLNFLE